MREYLINPEEEEEKRFINLQLFAAKEDDEEEEEDENKEISSEEEEEKDENEEKGNEDDMTEDDDESIGDRKYKILEREYELQSKKVNQLEQVLATLVERTDSQTELLNKLATSNQTKKKKSPTKKELDDLNSRDILLNKIDDMDREIKKRDEKQYISDILSKKPYMRDAVKKAKISSKEEYIRYMLPLEDEMKERSDIKKRLNDSEETDVFARYGINGGKRTAKSKKLEQKIADYGEELFGDPEFLG